MAAHNARSALPDEDRWRLAKVVGEVGLPVLGALLADEDGTPVDPRTLMSLIAGRPCNEPLRLRVAAARPYLPAVEAAQPQPPKEVPSV